MDRELKSKECPVYTEVNTTIDQINFHIPVSSRGFRADDSVHCYLVISTKSYSSTESSDVGRDIWTQVIDEI
jgi:hypothetical protein